MVGVLPLLRVAALLVLLIIIVTFALEPVVVLRSFEMATTLAV